MDISPSSSVYLSKTRTQDIESVSPIVWYKFHAILTDKFFIVTMYCIKMIGFGLISKFLLFSFFVSIQIRFRLRFYQTKQKWKFGVFQASIFRWSDANLNFFQRMVNESSIKIFRSGIYYPGTILRANENITIYKCIFIK